MVDYGYYRKVTHYVYAKKFSKAIISIYLYVDDMLIIRKDIHMIDRFKELSLTINKLILRTQIFLNQTNYKAKFVTGVIAGWKTPQYISNCILNKYIQICRRNRNNSLSIAVISMMHISKEHSFSVKWILRKYFIGAFKCAYVSRT